MHLSFIRYLSLLVGICVLLQTQAVPLSSNKSLILPAESSTELWREVGHSKRAPGRSARPARIKTTKRPAKKRPAKKRPAKKRPAKKRPAKIPNSPNRKTPARPNHLAKLQKASKTRRPEATATVKPLRYIRPKRPTNGYDVCAIPGFGCLTEYDNVDDNPKLLSGREESIALLNPGDFALSKRAIYRPKPGEPRIYKIRFAANDVFMIRSKPYYTSEELFSTAGLHLPKVYADYATDDLRNKDVKLFGSPQRRHGQQTSYVTEHIVELQSIPRFIETVTNTPNKRRDSHPIKLTKIVGKDFFKKQFKKQYPARVRDRPIIPDGRNPAVPGSRSIMDNVFEALGSKENSEDFVLCETGINSVKQRLWTNFRPADEVKTARLAAHAADGSIPSNEHLSLFRAILAVYEYMEAINDKMENEIQNVKTELSAKNIRSIVRNEEDMPQDEHGNIVDLGPLWQEYMQKLLARFERRGVDWLSNQIQYALPLYEEELKRLQKYVMRFKKEEADPNPDERLELMNKRTQKGNTYKEKLKGLEKDLKAAEKNQKVKQDKVNKLLAQITANKDRQAQKDKKEELKYYEFQKASDVANDDLYEAQRQVGLMRRKIDQTDEKLFNRLIKDVQDDIAQLKAYQETVKIRESKLQKEEMRLKMKYLVL